MKHTEYLDLPANRQSLVLKKMGVRISVRKTPVFYFILYQVGSFYIEVKCLRGTDDPITTSSFSSTTALNPYIKNIDISGIFDA
jgi:hypothetical protein